MEPGTRLPLVNMWVAATPLVYFGTPGLFAGKSSGDSELATTKFHINYLYYQLFEIVSSSFVELLGVGVVVFAVVSKHQYKIDDIRYRPADNHDFQTTSLSVILSSYPEGSFTT